MQTCRRIQVCDGLGGGGLGDIVAESKGGFVPHAAQRGGGFRQVPDTRAARGGSLIGFLSTAGYFIPVVGPIVGGVATAVQLHKQREAAKEQKKIAKIERRIADLKAKAEGPPAIAPGAPAIGPPMTMTPNGTLPFGKFFAPAPAPTGSEGGDSVGADARPNPWPVLALVALGLLA